MSYLSADLFTCEVISAPTTLRNTYITHLFNFLILTNLSNATWESFSSLFFKKHRDVIAIFLPQNLRLPIMCRVMSKKFYRGADFSKPISLAPLTKELLPSNFKPPNSSRRAVSPPGAISTVAFIEPRLNACSVERVTGSLTKSDFVTAG